MIDPRIDIRAEAVYARLDFIAGSKGHCHVGLATLADQIGCSVATVKRKVTDLERCGYLTVTRHRSDAEGHRLANNYTLPLRVNGSSVSHGSSSSVSRSHGSPDAKPKVTGEPSTRSSASQSDKSASGAPASNAGRSSAPDHDRESGPISLTGSRAAG